MMGEKFIPSASSCIRAAVLPVTFVVSLRMHFEKGKMVKMKKNHLTHPTIGQTN